MRYILVGIILVAIGAAKGPADLIDKATAVTTTYNASEIKSAGPECLSDPSNRAPFRKTAVSFESQGDSLRGHLYLPEQPGRYPAIVMMHGGGNNVDAIRSTPTYMAHLLARCDFIILVYDKRGTGNSEGDFSSSTFDDFVNDAGAGGKLLGRHVEVDDSKIGIMGFSQGGRLAPVAAVRFPFFSYVASVSGPIASVIETRFYAIKGSFEEAGVPQSTLDRVLPLWKRHLEAVASKDNRTMDEVDQEIIQVDDGYGGALLPPRKGAFPEGAIYNSMGSDYTEELIHLSKPWFSIYGAADRVVPVSTSVDNINRIKQHSGNTEIEYRIIPEVGHSFNGPEGTSHRFDLDVISWVFERVGHEVHTTNEHE